MSDPDLVDESADAAQSAELTDGSPPPWGDDFDAERAWKTISHLRGREKELESDAKRFKAIREDDDARREFLAELGYELAADDEDTSEFDDSDFADDEPVTQIPKALQKELDDLKAWRSQQEQREARQAFDDHLNRLAAGAEVELSPFERRAILAASIEAGFKPQHTEKAFKEYLEDARQREQQIIERYGKSKKAPRFSSSGKSATNVKPVHEMTDKERQAFMRERFESA